jgi:phenylacetate-CoA ligase
MIYNPKAETLSRDDMTQLQIERLQSTLLRVSRNVAFYKQMFDDHAIDIEKIKSYDDLALVPFTTREDLRKSYPYGMFAVPLREIVRIHSTSGTTGRPIVVGYTKNDLRNWSECTARVLSAAGVTEHDTVQVAFKYDLFTGGFGFHQGAELIGASVVPASTVQPEKQVMIMKDYKTTVLLCTPSFGLHIAAAVEDQKIHPEELFLKTGIFGAEPWSENVRKRIEASLHVKAFDTYGLTEVVGPGVAGECGERNGLHVNEDHFIVEVVNPNTLARVKPGEEGELVFTTITKEGFPVIRYRTGDIASIVSRETCACGRTTIRISRITGRTDDMIFFEGTKLFPSQVEEMLLAIKGTAPHYEIVLDTNNGNDTFELRVEVMQEFISIDKPKNLEALRQKISKQINEIFGIHAQVILVEPKTFAKDIEGKAKRVTDRRKL